MGKVVQKFSSQIFLASIVTVGLLFIVIGFFYSSFALVEPVKNISFSSIKLSYDEKVPGSWKLKNSAEWIDKGKARVTVDLDTVEKVEDRYIDLIYVMDVSFSMTGTKLQQSKEVTKEFFSSILSTSGNRIAFITFDNTSTILSGFTDDNEKLNNLVDGLYDRNDRSYYQMLVSVDEILKDYQFEEGRDCVVLFLTGGTTNRDTPNEVNYFKYLKDAYPYITVNAIQYEMGNSIIDSVRNISDNQYIASIRTLKEILLKASKVPVPYSEFKIENYIDTDYFDIESENDIKVDRGTISFNKEEQKVTWNLDNLASGLKTKMTMDLSLKNEFLNSGGVYSTNKQTKVSSRIESNIENVENDKTPRLKNEFQVSYEANLPEGCVVENIPGTKNYFTFDSVEVEEALSCDGYQFKGWKIVTENVNRPTENYFIMPESDVTFRGEWSNLSIVKSIDGTIGSYVEPVLQKIENYTYNKELWKYKTSITKVVIQSQIENIEEATETFDISESKNYGVVGYIVPNTDDVSATTYTAYIQGDGKIKANLNSAYWFDGFTNVESIEGLEYLDTSGVTNMRSMFASCYKLKNLDLSTFDTKDVTDMSYMFYDGRALTNLNLSSFNTSNVTNMNNMFYNCGSFTSLDVSNFSTSKVTNMMNMFYNCSSLVRLDLSNFDTSKVTDMGRMFCGCSKLEAVDVSHFDTSNVISMFWMFTFCYNLKDLDVSHFNTSKVINMQSMFFENYNVLVLDVSHFDTSNVASMERMFYACNNVTELDVSSFNTSKAQSFENLFYGCGKVPVLDVSNFDTSNVTSMERMFYGCNGITELDVSNFNTSKVKNFNNTFYGCYRLQSLDVRNFDTSSATNMGSMFYNCSGLTSLDLTNFNTLNVTDMSRMFAGCFSLGSLDLSNFDTSNVTNMVNMFEACSGFGSLDLSNFNTLNVTDMRYMFYGCWGLKELNLSNFNTSKVVDMRYMFYNCSQLKILNFDKLDTSAVTNMESMFNLCYNLVYEFTVSNPNTTGYDSMFVNAATGENAKIVVNYISETNSLVDLMIATKSSNSNVVKGNLVTI